MAPPRSIETAFPTAAVSSSVHATQPIERSAANTVAPVEPIFRRTNAISGSPNIPSRALMSCAINPRNTAPTTAQRRPYPYRTPAELAMNTDPDPK